LRENPERRIKCPTKDGDSSALFRSLVPAPAAMVAGYYEVMIEFQKFLQDLFANKCDEGYMTYGGLADAIEAGVVQRCSAFLE
jgi:hypothetical protein